MTTDYEYVSIIEKFFLMFCKMRYDIESNGRVDTIYTFKIFNGKEYNMGSFTKFNFNVEVTPPKEPKQ